MGSSILLIADHAAREPRYITCTNVTCNPVHITVYPPPRILDSKISSIHPGKKRVRLRQSKLPVSWEVVLLYEPDLEGVQSGKSRDRNYGSEVGARW